jgi:CheY-like chemotaxis protein
MDPVLLVIAAGAYVAAEVAKKTADSMLTAAYTRLEAYVLKKLGFKAAPEQLDAKTLRDAGLADDPVVLGFGREVIARSPALRRARLVESAVSGARILWVDDHPENNRSECRLLQALGAEVEQVASTSEVIRRVSGTRFDLVLSDMARGSEADAGIRMLGQLGPGAPPVVFYVGQIDPSRGVPRGAFGIADRPETLLHLVLDVLERSRV